MRNLTDWAATLRHSHSSFPDDLRDEIDRHNERIVGLIRAEGFKAGQEAMRERAVSNIIGLKNSVTAHDERIALQFASERIAAIAIAEPK